MGRSASLSTGDALANAIQAYNLPWGPSVSALLPFTSVLETMARDPVWLQQFGNAVLTQRPAVMDAIQRMRQRALEYGYLQPNSYMNVVTNAGYRDSARQPGRCLHSLLRPACRFLPGRRIVW
jgi:hypothetical protein